MIGTAQEVSHGSRWTREGGRTLRRHTAKLLASLLLVITAACGDSNPAGPAPEPEPSANDPVAGTFTLSTVNTQPLPYALFNDSGFRLEIASSTMAMQAGGQFVMAVTTREIVAGFASTFVDSTSGTWTQNRGAVTLTATGGESSSATWDGVRLAFPMQGETGTLALVFRKE